jgi:gluconate 2-dehydrogenase
MSAAAAVAAVYVRFSLRPRFPSIHPLAMSSTANLPARPRILVTRGVFPETIARLEGHFEVGANQDDAEWSRDELIARLQGCHGALTTGSVRIDETVLAACPELKICANMAVGYNNFDVAAMTRHGVAATNTPDVLTETTADFGFALLMATARRITESERYLRRGEWKKWSFDMFAGADVHGSTLGILGMGRIGQGIARRGALGFGMKVIYHNRSRLDAAVEAELGARYVSKEELLETADHLVLVLPYSPSSHHAIGAAELARMKPTATLVNLARGGIVDDAALAHALREKTLAAAGLDVFEGEPSVNAALLDVPNVVLTPHIASASIPTRRAMADLAADNLISFLQGRGALTPVTPVTPLPSASGTAAGPAA